MVSVHEHLDHNRDAHNTLDAYRRGQDKKREEADNGYHPRCGGCYDSGKDRSLSPDLSGPQAFRQHILNVQFPSQYQLPTNILKYSEETNPELWLKDDRLVCQASGMHSDSFIIRNLPLFLADLARTWIEHLSPNKIQSWADLKEISMGNF
jgi:hypothetical protein